MNLELSIHECQEAKGLGLSHEGAYNKIGPKFGQLHGTVFANGIPMVGMYGAYYVDPRSHSEDELRSMAAVTVEEGYSGPTGGLEPFTFDAGRYLVGRYIGSYDGLHDAWMHFVSKSVEEMGVETLDAPSYEHYLHHDEADPSKCVTDLYVRIA